MGAKPRQGPVASTGQRVVAFLRGMNLGKRRLSNVELCAAFDAIGVRGATAFLASGNVVFESSGEAETLEAQLEQGLEEQLAYPVPTFLRSAEELQAIANTDPFTAADYAASTGKVQVVFLRRPPHIHDAADLAHLNSANDRLELRGRELYWLPKGGLSESELDMKALRLSFGTTTIRTQRTVQRLVARFLT